MGGMPNIRWRSSGRTKPTAPPVLPAAYQAAQQHRQVHGQQHVAELRNLPRCSSGRTRPRARNMAASVRFFSCVCVDVFMVISMSSFVCLQRAGKACRHTAAGPALALSAKYAFAGKFSLRGAGLCVSAGTCGGDTRAARALRCARAAGRYESAGQPQAVSEHRSACRFMARSMRAGHGRVFAQNKKTRSAKSVPWGRACLRGEP